MIECFPLLLMMCGIGTNRLEHIGMRACYCDNKHPCCIRSIADHLLRILIPAVPTHNFTAHQGLGRGARDNDRIGLHVIGMNREFRVLPPQYEPAASLGSDGIPVVNSCMCIPIFTLEARRCLEEPQPGIERRVDEEMFQFLPGERVGRLCWSADWNGKLRYLFIVIFVSPWHHPWLVCGRIGAGRLLLRLLLGRARYIGRW